VDEMYEMPRIVVGVDGSEHSRRALRWAAHLALQLGAVTEAVYVWEPPVQYGMTPGLATFNCYPGKDAEHLLDKTVDDVFGSERPLGMRLVAIEGYPAKVLTEQGSGALLLVLGSRGRTGVAARVLGSVSAACSKAAHCPVLVVHDTEPPVRVATPTSTRVSA
jgi:nucleotide-binding universal stress UspA family protein